MPNLEYDPKNPTDLLGRPIKEGDTVIWSSTYGKSAAINVGIIDRINFTLDPGYAPYKRVPREEAERYTLTLQPLQSTSHTWPQFWAEPVWLEEPRRIEGERWAYTPGVRNPAARQEFTGEPPKKVTILHVKNVILAAPITDEELWTPR